MSSQSRLRLSLTSHARTYLTELSAGRKARVASRCEFEEDKNFRDGIFLCHAANVEAALGAMARVARIVAPGRPHLVTQSGNRNQDTFLGIDDFRLYKEVLATQCQRAGVVVWAYCLMPSYVQLLMVPNDTDGLRAALGEAHRRYSAEINKREGWRGHLWQERFQSFAMDRKHAVAAAREILRNPVRAKLVKKPKQWPWSSARAHLAGTDDELVTVAPLADLIDDWRKALRKPIPPDRAAAIAQHTRNGRPLGAPKFITELEGVLGRSLQVRPRGRPRKADVAE